MRCAAVLLLLLAGCSESTGIECTGIGCASGLQVNFDRVPPSGTVVILQFDSSEVRWEVECGTDANCSNGLFFPGLVVDYVALRLVTAEGEILHELRPEYEVSHPNGPDCPPTCRNATVTVALPTDA